MADLAWWFGFQPSELWNMEIQEVMEWVEQADRQVSAKYSKGF